MSNEKDLSIIFKYNKTVENKIPKSFEIYENNNKNLTFFEKIKKFFKSQFYFFLKNYLFYLILLSICFYILHNLNSKSTNRLVLIESKIFFYLLIMFLFIIVNDIMKNPQKSQKKLLFIIFISLILVQISNYLIDKYYDKEKNNTKLLKIIGSSLIIFIITSITISLSFKKENKIELNDLYKNVNNVLNKNFTFMVFIFLYLFIFQYVFSYFHDWNSSLSDILMGSVLGLMLILFIFSYLINLMVKLKIINKLEYLNAFIALSAIAVFLGLVCIHTFMSSLSTICKTDESVKDIHQEEFVSILLLLSIIYVLWLDDTRNWHRNGSMLFLLITFLTFFCISYYSVKHPNTGLLSFWLFIEWMILVFYNTENSKNSIHFSLMNV